MREVGTSEERPSVGSLEMFLRMLSREAVGSGFSHYERSRVTK